MYADPECSGAGGAGPEKLCLTGPAGGVISASYGTRGDAGREGARERAVLCLLGPEGGGAS